MDGLRLAGPWLAGALILQGVAPAAEAGPASPTAAVPAVDLAGRLTAPIRESVERGDIPGGVVLAGQGPEVLVEAAVGQAALLPQPSPMRVDTIFDMASATKPLATTVAMHLLIEGGAVAQGVDTPVAALLGERWPAGKGRVLLRHLMTHTSGLPAYLNAPDLQARYPGRPGLEQVWAGIVDTKLRSEPGTAVLYSCLNYIAVARIVEAVAGEPLDVFLRRRVWEPLGMVDTGFRLGYERLARCAPSTPVNGHYLQGVVHDPLARLLQDGGPACSGNAGLFSTARDTAVLLRALLRVPTTPGALLPRSRTVLFSPQTPSGLEPIHSCGWVVYPPGDGFAIPAGLGDLSGRLAFGHTGYTGTMVWMEPESGLYLVLLTNRVHPRDAGTVQPLRRAVIRAFVTAWAEGGAGRARSPAASTP